MYFIVCILQPLLSLQHYYYYSSSRKRRRMMMMKGRVPMRQALFIGRGWKKDIYRKRERDALMGREERRGWKGLELEATYLGTHTLDKGVLVDL